VNLEIVWIGKRNLSFHGKDSDEGDVWFNRSLNFVGFDSLKFFDQFHKKNRGVLCMKAKGKHEKSDE